MSTKKHANVNNLDHSNWEAVELVDNSGMIGSRGAFVNHPWQTFEVNGEQIEGLGYLHARIRYYSLRIENMAICSLCNHSIQYSVIFKDGDNYYATGETCADFVQSKLPNHLYLTRKKIMAARKVTLKDGTTKYVMKLDINASFWNTWKAIKAKGTKPAFLSVSKYEGRWRASIWASDRNEMRENYEAYQALF